jgi:uncharacterized SAM-binding protein YcdF (DUF218 family)
MNVRPIQVLGVAVSIGIALAAFTPLVEWLAAAMIVPARPESAAAIVVLGAGAADGVLSEASLRRTVHGVQLYRRGLAPVLVLSGDPKEVVARTALVTELGVPLRAIVTETAVRTTREEARAVAARFHDRPRARVLLVTDAPVMRRASAVFARAGLEVLPAPPPHVRVIDGPERRLQLAREVLMEVGALVYYDAAGYL